MNWAHVHLLVNHVAPIGAVLGLLVLVLGLAKRNGEFEKAAFWIFVWSALGAAAAYFTGEPAEEAVEHLPGVSGAFVSRHEDAALVALIAIGMLGLLAAVGLVRARGAVPLRRGLVFAGLVLSIVAAGLLAWTATLGGQIRHTEIRGSSGSTPGADPAEAPGAREERHPH
jgi:uncharacterized membrane protein